MINIIYNVSVQQYTDSIHFELSPGINSVIVCKTQAAYNDTVGTVKEIVPLASPQHDFESAPVIGLFFFFRNGFPNAAVKSRYFTQFYE